MVRFVVMLAGALAIWVAITLTLRRRQEEADAAVMPPPGAPESVMPSAATGRGGPTTKKLSDSFLEIVIIHLLCGHFCRPHRNPEEKGQRRKTRRGGIRGLESSDSTV